LEIAARAIIRAYGDILTCVSENGKAEYPACVYPESLLPIPKSALASLLTTELQLTSDANERRALESSLVLLDGFVDDEQANEQNAALKAAVELSRRKSI
jgi:hypothetical protein